MKQLIQLSYEKKIQSQIDLSYEFPEEGNKLGQFYNYENLRECTQVLINIVVLAVDVQCNWNVLLI